MGPCSPEIAKKKSDGLLKRNQILRDAGIPHHNTGRVAWNRDQKGIQTAWNKGLSKPQSPCPHCTKMVDATNMKRWHGDNCKSKKD
jgi:hypothetical protein